MILDQNIVIGIHQRLIEKTGGRTGIKDINLLNSAISSIYQTFDGKDLYPSVIEKAARLCYQLNKNHAFIDGNKRLSMHMLALFLRMHDIDYRPSNKEVIDIGLSLASNEMSYEALLEWIKITVARK